MTAAYCPIIRNGPNEKEVIQSFGGLSHFEDTELERPLHPILEVKSVDDLQALPLYEDAGERVYIDLPVAHTERATKLTEGVTATLNKHGSREEFFREHSDQIGFPLISSLLEARQAPVEYGVHLSVHRALEDEFDRIGHRLMIRSLKPGLTDKQKEALRELAEVTRPDRDVLMFDIVDSERGEERRAEKDIRFLSNLFDGYETGVLNAFDPMNGQTENRGPNLADRYNCDFFGDYAIDQRFPPKMGGRPKSVKLRHYHPEQRDVAVFPGKDYAVAGRDLLGWDEWDRDHCNHCRQIASLVQQGKGNDFNRWKQARMGHYIHSVVHGE